MHAVRLASVNAWHAGGADCRGGESAAGYRGPCASALDSRNLRAQAVPALLT